MANTEEYNPFFDESADIDSGKNRNPFDDDSEIYFDNDVSDAAPKPIMQIDESEQKNGIATYTSLEEEQQHQVVNIMRSLSMDDDVLKTKASDQDLCVRVDSPEKHVEGYVSYCVSTQATRPEYEASEYKVRRRYQDFLWLRQRLEESNPTHIIPPLPEKFTFSKHLTDKYDSDFLKTRQKALDKFMRRIVNHEVLSFNESVKVFLTAKAWEMSTARKKQPGAAYRVGGSVRNTAAQLMMKNRPEEFTEMAKYNTQLQAKLKQFATIADNIAQERFYLLEDNQEYGSTFRLWANSESKLSDTLTAVAKSLDFSIENLKSILRVHEIKICQPIREYSLYCDSVKTALKKRDQFQIEHELVTEELGKRKTEKDEIEASSQAKSLSALFGKDPEKVKEEKLTKVNQQIRELQNELEVLADKEDKANHDFRADMERWHSNKKQDMRSLFLEIAERQISFYEANMSAWKSSLDIIDKPRKVHQTIE